MKPKSGHNCSVYGCMNTQRNADLSFFSLPTDRERRNEWLQRIGRPDLLTNTDIKPTSYRVCSIHFEEYMMSSVLIRKLLPDAIPTKFLTDQPSPSKCEDGSENTTVSVDIDVSTQTKDCTSSLNPLTTNGIRNVCTTTTGTQTEDPEQMAQTSVALSDVHRKRKLLAQLQEFKNKTRKVQRELNAIKQNEVKRSSLSSDDHDDEILS